jgi:hypothetical protein
MDRFNYVGVIETFPAFDRTPGWQRLRWQPGRLQANLERAEPEGARRGGDGPAQHMASRADAGSGVRETRVVSASGG